MRKRVLVITHGLPFPVYGGTKMRNGDILRHLGREYSVHLRSITWESELHHLPLNREYCDSMDVVVAARSEGEMWRGLLRGLYDRRPLAIASLYFDEMANKIRSFLSAGSVDIILFAESATASYLSAVPLGSCEKTVIDFHNIASKQYRSMTRMRLGWGARMHSMGLSFLMRGWEGRYASQVDCCLAVAESDAAWLRERAPRTKIEIVPNGICPSNFLEEPRVGNTLLFVGTIGYLPNADAMLFFCNFILPLIRAEVPKVKLYVVGLNPPPAIKALEALGNVVVTGEVEDLLPYYQEAQVVVVPMRAGGGTRLKILEAMSLGRPVVTTSVGQEGLAVKHGEHLLIADRPTDFAKQVVALLGNPSLARHLCLQARQLVEQHYDSNMIGEKFLSILRML